MRYDVTMFDKDGMPTLKGFVESDLDFYNLSEEDKKAGVISLEINITHEFKKEV